MFQLGTVSHATMRPQDLIPAFIAKIEELKGHIPGDLECGTHLEYTNLPNYDQLAVIDDDDDYWESDAASYDLESLFETLNELAPKFVAFGSHEGDGSDYGFWVQVDAIAEAYEAADPDTLNETQDFIAREYTLADESVIVLHFVDDDITLMDLDRKEIWSTV
jgi:hypothetical protein